jgi:hypothetical protein
MTTPSLGLATPFTAGEASLSPRKTPEVDLAGTPLLVVQDNAPANPALIHQNVHIRPGQEISPGQLSHIIG